MLPSFSLFARKREHGQTGGKRGPSDERTRVYPALPSIAPAPPCLWPCAAVSPYRTIRQKEAVFGRAVLDRYCCFGQRAIQNKGRSYANRPYSVQSRAREKLPFTERYAFPQCCLFFPRKENVFPLIRIKPKTAKPTPAACPRRTPLRPLQASRCLACSSRCAYRIPCRLQCPRTGDHPA